MPNDRFRSDRESVLFHSKRMWEAGLVVASAGNVSARVPGHNALAVTPTSISYDVMTADQVVIVSLDSGLPIESTARPSGSFRPTSPSTAIGRTSARSFTRTRPMSRHCPYSAGRSLPSSTR